MLIPDPPEPIAWAESPPPHIVWPEADLPSPIVEADAALVLPEDTAGEVFVQPQLTETLMLPSGGDQGPAGPQQIYVQAIIPASPLFPAVLFRTGQYADPEIVDLYLNLDS